jgi:CRP/FNR family transcriptional regulator
MQQCERCSTGLTSFLRRVPVFQSLTLEELQQLSPYAAFRFPDKGEAVFREGGRADALYILVDGLIKLSRNSNTGKEHILRLLYPGDAFGQFALLQEKQYYATAEAAAPSVVCRISGGHFLPLLERKPQLAYRFLQAAAEQLQQADEWADAMNVLDVEQRLAKLLVHCRDKRGSCLTQEVELPTAKKDLSALLGTSPETLSRKLAQWVQSGIISMRHRSIRVLDQERLVQLSRGYK